MRMKSRIVFVLAFCWVLNAQAQLNVTTVTPEEAVEALVGPSLQVSNISFTGDAIQLGVYENAGGDFPFADGIILSTSHAGDFEPNSFLEEPTSPVNTEDDLLTIANSVPPLINQSFVVEDVNDVAILEFDFVASCPTLTFQYAFGSDEYLTYVNSQYNDVFAFLISGPGISGPYAAPATFPDGAANLAIVPDSDPPLPITISSVNNVLNSEYYLDNGSGQNETIQLNGYTDSLVVYSDLICGATYHMKLAIADGTDNILKSIVVFKPESFECFEPALALEPSEPLLVGEPSLYEGCVNGTLRLTPPACAADTVVMWLEYSGSATFGSDYSGENNTPLPDSIIFVGDEELIVISVFADTDDELFETLGVTGTYVTPQGDTISAFTTINIYDYIEPQLSVDDVLVCEQFTVNPTIVGGIPPYSFNWDGEQTDSSIEVTPADTGLHYLVITDLCEIQASTSYYVDYSELIVPTTDSLFCAANLNTLVLTAAPQVNPNLVYTWTLNGIPQSVNTSSFDISAFGNYTLTVTDVYCSRTDAALFEVPNYVFPSVFVGDALACAEITVAPQLVGGLEPIQYNWDGQETTSTVQYLPEDAGIHYLVVTDRCNETDSVSFFVDYSPEIVLSEGTFDFCEATLPFQLPVGVQVNPLLDYTWMLLPEDSIVSSEPSYEATAPGIYTILIQDTRCPRSKAAQFHVAPKIVLEDAEYRTCWEQINSDNPLPVVAEGSGFPQGESWFWALTENLSSTTTSLSFNDTYLIKSPDQNGLYTVIATQNEFETGCSNRDTASISINLIPCSLIIPNIMTPNGDGNNDAFIGQSNVLTAGINADVVVFNRWGTVVYENKRYIGDWQAAELPDGTYYYIVKITGNGLNDIYEGDLTILR
jgi:gliding motility-associated-like protein